MSGKFITLEGIDGAGKSSHLSFIADCVKQRGHEAFTTREPGGTPLGEQLRQLLLHEKMHADTEVLLMFASRREQLLETIQPLLDRGTWVICEEIDLCDADFHRRALELLRHADCDMVVGSKAMNGASDERPLFRRVATRVINTMLRVALDFRGTDTHGLKAFHRETLLPVVEACVIDRDLFASELVIRAGRSGLHVLEIPIRLNEKRPPAINLVKRVPNVLKGIARMTYVIRFGGKP